MIYSKQKARKIIQNRLDNINIDSANHTREAILARASIFLREVSTQRALSNVLIYSATSRWHEVDTSPLQGEFEEISFEVLAISPHARPKLSVYDAVFVPLFGFNSRGYRLGHGGGWYDRFFSTQPEDTLKVGIGLSISRIEFEEEPHDVPMSVVITESRIVYSGYPVLTRS